MKTEKHLAKELADAKRGRRRGGRFGKKAGKQLGKTRKSHPKAKAKVWCARRRVTDAEVHGWVFEIVNWIERERRRCGASYEDLAGVAGVSRQCLGKSLGLKCAPLLSTLLCELYALGMDRIALEFAPGTGLGKGAAGGGRGPLQLRIQVGGGCAKVRPCHRNR